MFSVTPVQTSVLPVRTSSTLSPESWVRAGSKAEFGTQTPSVGGSAVASPRQALSVGTEVSQVPEVSRVPEVTGRSQFPTHTPLSCLTFLHVFGLVLSRRNAREHTHFLEMTQGWSLWSSAA